ncbi:ABC transporter ATP-binding protein, partial [Candidatus Bathyarchaeota archaeon]|nr:ABC transporter ATP-binding protein [Candidatus Bathyarchaeota archaeon]
LIGYISKYWELKAILILILFTTASTAISPAIVGNIIDMIRAVAEGNTIEASEGVGEIAYQMLIPFADWLSLVREMDPGKATLFVFSFALIVLSILEGVFSYMQRYLLTIISQRAGFDMRDDMYNSLLEQSFSFYDQQRTGQLMARATGDINMLGRFFNMAFRMAISNILVLITVIYSMTSLSPELTLIAMVTIPFLLFTTSSFSKRVRPMWKEVREQNGVLTSVLQENLSGLRVVRGFSREEYEEEKFGAEVKKFFDINVTMARVRAFFMPMASLISSVGIVIIIWYGGKQVITGALTLGTVLAFYFYMNRLMGPVRMLGFMTSMFVRAQAAAERVFEIIDAEIDVHDKDDAQEFMTVEGHLVFEDVWFSYDGQNMVLTEIELDVKPGQTIAILGATGSGKSSIINLIPRFYDVSKGSIKLDGLDIRDITIKNLRSHIGIVRQDPYIFSTTLRENIAYGVESTSTKGIEEAAKQAKIHEFIASLPEGYDTKVGERGVTLSGGQKQRVAIARALLKNPKILVLDDSTSSVDTQTEYEIQQALDQLLENRTTFVITQRLSSIKKADYIIVLEDGAIAEEGSHEHLMALDGIYRKLYDTQITGARGGDL